MEISCIVSAFVMSAVSWHADETLYQTSLEDEVQMLVELGELFEPESLDFKRDMKLPNVFFLWTSRWNFGVGVQQIVKPPARSHNNERPMFSPFYFPLLPRNQTADQYQNWGERRPLPGRK